MRPRILYAPKVLRKPYAKTLDWPLCETLCGTSDGPYAGRHVSPSWRNLRLTFDGPYAGLRRALDSYDVAGGRSG
jgi:hypothetical protein